MMIEIFDKSFDLKDICERYETMTINKKYRGIGSVSITLLSLDEASKFDIGDYLLINGESYVVEYLHKYKDFKHQVNVEITAPHINKLASHRIALNGVAIPATSSYEKAAESLINDCMINASDSNRNISNMTVKESSIITYPTTLIKYNVMALDSLLNKMLSLNKLGWNITIDYDNKQFVFEVLHPKYSLDEVIFTEEYGNVSNSDYYDNVMDIKNVCYAGESLTEYGSGQGIERKEMYLDSDYNNELSNSKELISASTDILNNGVYEYGVDYELGSIVTYYDVDLNIQTSQQIKEVKETYASTNSIEITIGDYVPTVFDKLKKGV